MEVGYFVARKKWFNMRIEASEKAVWEREADREGCGLSDLVRRRLAPREVPSEPLTKAVEVLEVEQVDEQSEEKPPNTTEALDFTHCTLVGGECEAVGQPLCMGCLRANGMVEGEGG